MIREASLSDIPEISQLLQQILQVHHQARPDLFQAKGQKCSPEELENMITDSSQSIFVYEEKGELLGHLFCQVLEKRDTVLVPIKTLWIDDLCVSEKARGKGIGEQLYQFAVQYAKEQGCYNLTLDAWNDNQGAFRFYERLGLKPQKTCMEQIL